MYMSRVWNKEIYLGPQQDSILVEPSENWKTSFRKFPATIIHVASMVNADSFAWSGNHKLLYKFKLFNNVALSKLPLVSSISSRHSQAFYVNCPKTMGMSFSVKWILKKCQKTIAYLKNLAKDNYLQRHLVTNIIIIYNIAIGTMVKGLLLPRLWRISTGVHHTVCWLLLIWWGSRTHCFYIDPISEVRHIYILVYFIFLQQLKAHLKLHTSELLMKASYNKNVLHYNLTIMVICTWRQSSCNTC